MNKESITKITDEITKLLLKKNQDYGGASFDLGLNGNMVHLWDKISRYRNLINIDNEPNFECIEDTLKDIIGYAIIGLHIIHDDSVIHKIYGDYLKRL
ncbi:MAG: hypothetical protein H6Q15_462 [Bacteroidetes bacterium]|nr:hypothetical protein [Bacteroidota bacterium]